MRAAALALALVAGAACSSTRLTSVWVGPDRPAASYRRILVVGLPDTRGSRVAYERDFAARVAEHGVLGIPSHDVVPALEDFERRRVTDWARERGVGAVLVSRLREVRDEPRYVRPELDPDPWSGWPVVTPGYWTLDRTVVVETSLFDGASGRLAYSATSESWNPDSDSQVAWELVEALVADLAERGLLSPRSPPD